jgi:hypothetical protein
VRRYRPYCVVSTEPGGVYDRDSYLAASEQLMAYKGDANNKPQNTAGMVVPFSDCCSAYQVRLG